MSRKLIQAPKTAGNNPKGLAQVVKALALKVCFLQGPRFNTSWCKQFLGIIPSDEKPVIYPNSCREKTLEISNCRIN
jgi:hypothetical protein